MVIAAEVIGHAASSCQAPAAYGPEADATGRVVRAAPFQVLPEGLTRLHTESAYFCANGEPGRPGPPGRPSQPSPPLYSCTHR